MCHLLGVSRSEGDALKENFQSTSNPGSISNNSQINARIHHKSWHESPNYTLLDISMASILMNIKNSEQIKWPKPIKNINSIKIEVLIVSNWANKRRWISKN